MTLNKGAVHRWLLGQAERSAISRECETMANVNNHRYIDVILVFIINILLGFSSLFQNNISYSSFRLRKNLDKTRIEADEKVVVDVIKTIESFINPFENDHEGLVHLASGTVATSAVAKDMKTMEQRGEAAAVEFIKTRIAGKEMNLYSTLKKTKLQTFSIVGKKVTSKSRKGELVAMKNSKVLFAKMLLISKSRNLDMEEVLKYSLRPFPSSLATSEGDLVKTAKSKLLQTIEEEVQDASVDLPAVEEKAYILDAMAVLQTLSVLPATFCDLAINLLVTIVNMAVFSNCKRVDSVCDRYPSQSIKNMERVK